MSTAFKYVGPGHHYGVPARDITPEEYEALEPRLQRIVSESPAYKGTSAKAKTSTTTTAKDDDAKKGRE